MSRQSRSGGGGGMQTSGYEGSQPRAGGAAVVVGAGVGRGVVGGTVVGAGSGGAVVPGAVARGAVVCGAVLAGPATVAGPEVTAIEDAVGAGPPGMSWLRMANVTAPAATPWATLHLVGWPGAPMYAIFAQRSAVRAAPGASSRAITNWPTWSRWCARASSSMNRSRGRSAAVQVSPDSLLRLLTCNRVTGWSAACSTAISLPNAHSRSRSAPWNTSRWSVTVAEPGPSNRNSAGAPAGPGGRCRALARAEYPP